MSRPGLLRWGVRAGVLAGGALVTEVVRRRAASSARQSSPAVPAPLGSLHCRPRTVTSADGVPLCVEVAQPTSRHAALVTPTLVFVPGFCLSMDAWHFQREALSGAFRCVFFDQRGHGRSGRGLREHATIEWLARDLRAVLDAVAPDGPVVLCGHSLGGMVTMAYAAAYPEEFGSRVVGAALIATSPGRLAEMTLGLPAAVMRRLWPLGPGMADRLATLPAMRSRGLRSDRGVGLLAVRRLSFARPDVSADVVRFAGSILAGTPADVFAELFAEFDRHDKEAALPVFASCPTLIVAGESDVITPAAHSRAMAAILPEAELLVLPQAGHLLQLEYPDEVNAALRRLLDRAAPTAAASGRSRRAR